MKKLLFILIGVLYTWSVSGVSINTHYCGGKISHVSFSFSPEKCGCGDSMPSDCCKDELQSFKVEDSHQAAYKVPLAAKESISLYILQPFTFSFYHSPFPAAENHFPSRPPLLTCRHFIQNCVLLI